MALNPDAKFSFRDRIEPVYQGYVELLLSDIQQQSDTPQQQRLHQIRDTMEALQLAELHNYFREACLTYQTREIEDIDPHASHCLSNSIEQSYSRDCFHASSTPFLLQHRAS